MLSLLGCPQPERLADSPLADPRRATPISRFEPVPIDLQLMTSHAHYDRWEDQVIDRNGAIHAFNLYQEAMTHKRGNRLTFVRWMLLSYRSAIPRDYRDSLKPFVEGLKERSERMGPDMRYLVGFMAFKQLVDSAINPNLPTHLENGAIIDTVITNWSVLAANFPEWQGPRGVNAESVAAQVAALKASIHTPVNSQKKALLLTAKEREFWNAFEGFHREYEDLGFKKGCRKVDAALQVAAKPTLLGDAYAHCALDRGNPGSALEQLERMLKAKVTGGFPAVMMRIEAASKGNSEVKKRLAKFKKQLLAAAKSDPVFAAHSGLSAWTKKTP
jgi:hypothetical protein